MNKYQTMKEKIRQVAINWQNDIIEKEDISQEQLNVAYDYFETMGQRYGLLTEFRENGII